MEQSNSGGPLPVRPRSFMLALLLGAVLVTPPAVAAAAEPPVPTFAANGESFVYSDLLAAMRAGQVRAAQVDTRRGKATVWLSGGRKEGVTFAPWGASTWRPPSGFLATKPGAS
jgi:hypothetical protein